MFINKKYLNVSTYIWISFILLSLIFIFYPNIDIYTSSLFFDDTKGYYDKWYLKRSLFESLFYYSIRPIIITTAFLITTLFLFNIIKKKEILGIKKRVFVYLILVLSLAPGLIINAGLKINWDRARPIEIKEFHGSKEFTPAFILSDQNGQSFSSGHVAAAFSLYGIALLAQRRRAFWIKLTLTYGFGMSIARIAAGGHFLSDTVTSFFIVYIITNILYYYLIEKK